MNHSLHGYILSKTIDGLLPHIDLFLQFCLQTQVNTSVTFPSQRSRRWVTPAEPGCHGARRKNLHRKELRPWWRVHGGSRVLYNQCFHPPGPWVHVCVCPAVGPWVHVCVCPVWRVFMAGRVQMSRQICQFPKSFFQSYVFFYLQNPDVSTM